MPQNSLFFLSSRISYTEKTSPTEYATKFSFLQLVCLAFNPILKWKNKTEDFHSSGIVSQFQGNFWNFLAIFEIFCKNLSGKSVKITNDFRARAG